MDRKLIGDGWVTQIKFQLSLELWGEGNCIFYFLRNQYTKILIKMTETKVNPTTVRLHFGP